VLVLETERLALRELTLDDAAFMLGLLNEPSFLEHIGDKGVRTEADAREHIRTGPVASYDAHGFGLYLVSLRDTGEPIGTCGLLKRDALEDVDLGFALRPEFWSQGYAFEAASAVIAYARDTLGLSRIVAIVSPDNAASIGLLERLGLAFEKCTRLSETAPEVRLFAMDLGRQVFT